MEARTASGTTTTKTYTYDLNGNLLTVSEGGAITESYTYDAFGKMLSYTKSGTTTAYTYRPDGMLYTKQTGSNASTKKIYISSDGQIVFEQTGTDNVGAVVYSYGLTRISAKSRTALTAQQGIRYYYLYNAHGDVVRIISGTNVTVKTYDYDAFGNDRSAVAGDTNPFRYCGEYFDTVTETCFLRARWYDPTTGRFTQQDAWEFYNTEDPLSLNLYVYCFGNPVRYVDPTGHWIESDSQFSSTVQTMLLQLTVAWYMAPTVEQRNDISKRADEIRQTFSSGIGAFLDKGKSFTGALADEFSWFIGGDVSAAERDYWLSEAQKFQSDIVIDDKKALRSIIFVAGIVTPSPDDAWRLISKRASKEMIETVGEKGARKFLKSMTQYAASYGTNGIKKLKGAGIKGFMYEVKVKGVAGAYRLLGNKTATGEIFWEVFEKTH